MPVVFVHGNPETTAIWQPMLAGLARDDVVCLSPPGFGTALPADVVGQLRGIGLQLMITPNRPQWTRSNGTPS